MNKLVKKYILLFFVIAIPLTAAFLVCSYGYNSEKFGQGAWKNEFRDEYLSFGNEQYTTKQKIDKYLKYGLNNQYYIYDETPIINKEIKNSEGEKLLDLMVYRAIYKFTIDDEFIDRIQYLYIMYNVQYKKVRDTFVADSALRKEIESANVPTFKITVSELLENDAIGQESKVTEITSKFVPDYDADVDFISGIVAKEQTPEDDDELVYIFTGFQPIREIERNTKNRIEITAVIDEIKKEDNEGITSDIASFEVEDYITNPKELNFENYANSYKQDLKNAGLLAWTIKNYLWWIGLITLVAIGLITESFYVVWLAEDQRQIALKKAKKVKK